MRIWIQTRIIGYRLYHKTPHVFRSISPFKLHKKWIRFQNPMLGSRLGSALGKICWILICRKRRQIHNPDPHSLFYHLRFFFQHGSWSVSTPGYQKMVKKQLVYISELHKLCYHHQHSTILSCFSHQSKKLINFFNSPRFSANVKPKIPITVSGSWSGSALKKNCQIRIRINQMRIHNPAPSDFFSPSSHLGSLS